MIVIVYIAVIILANVVTAAVPPIAAGPFLIPTGTLLVGLAFILRDFTQNRIGKARAYAVIMIALILSAVTSCILGDPIHIVLASAAAFVLSETIDTEVYSRFKGSFASRVALSGIFGGTMDSIVFVILGLSPIGAGFLPWELVPIAIAGQFITKTLLALTGAGYIQIIGGRKAHAS